jgi:hypothetical protein
VGPGLCESGPKRGVLLGLVDPGRPLLGSLRSGSAPTTRLPDGPARLSPLATAWLPRGRPGSLAGALAQQRQDKAGAVIGALLDRMRVAAHVARRAPPALTPAQSEPRVVSGVAHDDDGQDHGHDGGGGERLCQPRGRFLRGASAPPA